MIYSYLYNLYLKSYRGGGGRGKAITCTASAVKN